MAEASPGQFEINLHHTDNVLDACDDALALKRLVRLMAEQDARHFYGEAYEEHAGSGMHIHISMLNNKGKTCWWGRLCAAQTRAGRDDRSDAGLDGAAGAERELVSPLPAGDVRPDAGFVGA